MFCQHCGKQLNESAKFCSGCGSKVSLSNILINQGKIFDTIQTQSTVPENQDSKTQSLREYTFSGKLTYEEFRSARKYLLYYNIFYGWRKIVFIPFIIIWLGIPVLLMLIYFPIFCRILYKNNKFNFNFKLTKENIEIKNNDIVKILTKDKISKVFYDKNNIYILSSLGYHIIPERFLNNTDLSSIKGFIDVYYKKT